MDRGEWTGVSGWDDDNTGEVKEVRRGRRQKLRPP